ncbi:Sterol 3-beta-glucosyltransferase [Apiospora rasikravindrae]|uniref:Sterol 3-beta-glucosyltransferase n=1 Tax=Apiospora rasikravindrae TaxID=990691 RepID=A0ABR1T5C1_9PEZI
MPGLELDKPPSGPIKPDPSDESLQITDTRSEDRPGAVVRDADGSIVYPSLVPPDIVSPVSPPKTAAAAEDERPRAKTDDGTSAPAKTKTEPLKSPHKKKNERPSLEGQRRFVTDAPQGFNRTVTALPAFKRAGTNISVLNAALQARREQEETSDSSDSSASEDEHDDHEETPGAPQEQSQTPAKEKRRRSDDQYRRFKVGNEQYKTKGKVKRDGRLNITVHDTSNTGYLAKALGTAVKRIVPKAEKAGSGRASPSRLSSATTTTSESARRPKLNIVIMVIGSRGDAQPFLKIGKVLKENYGHRVRIATHPAFREFVENDSGLEFFSVGGDPSELMAFMVKNPGMIPKLESVKAGDIGRRRNAMAEMFDGFWRACINATDNEKDEANLKMMGHRAPFVADAIIANPPSFAHIHCAEALGIPLHLMFTFPYTPTQAFPHPLASIKKTNVDPGYTNFMSYPLVEMMVWQGLGDLVNDFRVNTLKLDPVSTLWAPGSTYRLHVPYTYLWSPGLVPKPEDWGPEIDIAGFTFLDLASTFKPPQDLVEFLDAGDKPIYIGFGSIVVDDADKFTEMIFEGVKKAGVRALVSKGWGGLGGENTPDNIYMLENTPHDWLFPKVQACVIHGGAGTTAIALKCGLPTMVVPFFGDQHFWGSMIGTAGAGPEAVPYKQLDVDKLADGIKFCLTDKAREGAQKIAKSIEAEGDGAKNAVKSFHNHLAFSGEESMRCSILSDRVAVWKVKDTSIKLSAVAADILVEKGLLSWRRLRLIRHKEWNDFEGPGEPVTGLAGAMGSAIGEFFTGVGSVPMRIARTSTKRTERKKKKEAKRQQKLTQKKKAAEPKTPKPTEPTTNGTSSEFPFPNNPSDAENSGMQQQQQSEQQNQMLRPPAHTQLTNNSILTATTPGMENAAEEYGADISKGLEKSGKAIAQAPVDLAMAIAQGFHNAPRLYGDDTVRRPPRVTGIKSGMQAAGHEFVFGMYDGVTGIVRLPVKGAKQDGFGGALGGVAMGFGGLVLKPIAAIVSPFGYTLKGISKQLERRHNPARYVRRARIVQAQRDLLDLPPQERTALSEETYKGYDIMRQLGELVLRENGKRSIAARLHRRPHLHYHHPDRNDTGNEEDASGSPGEKFGLEHGEWGRGQAFESVELAEKAIAAVKNGEPVNAVLGKTRRSLDPERAASRGGAGSTKGHTRHKSGSRRLSRQQEEEGEVKEKKKKEEKEENKKKVVGGGAARSGTERVAGGAGGCRGGAGGAESAG